MNMFSTKTLTMILLGILTGVSLFLVSCEGPAGKDGIAGKDGKDGEEQCGVCHNSSSVIVAKQLQWENSQHAIGTEFDHASASCAGCHTSEGFHETIKTGEFNTAAEIINPSGQTCRTCHNVHKDYAETDWSLTKEGEVKFRSSDLTFDFGKGAVCATCHQSRSISPVLDISNASATYQISNTNFGPHYSTAANAYSAIGAFEIPGSENYVKTFAHQNVLSNSCVDCHMGKARGGESGGHTMKMSYNDGATDYVASCTGCHTDAKNFDFYGTQTDTKKLLSDLRAKLIENDLITPSNDDNWSNDRPKAGTYPVYTAAAIYNYRWVLADQSMGIHNPKYIKAVLKNSISALN